VRDVYNISYTLKLARQAFDEPASSCKPRGLTLCVAVKQATDEETTETMWSCQPTRRTGL